MILVRQERLAFDEHRAELARALWDNYDSTTADGMDAITAGQLALAWTSPEVMTEEDFTSREVRGRYALLISSEIARQASLGVASRTFTTVAVEIASEILAFDPALHLVDPEVARGLHLKMLAVVAGVHPLD